MNLKEITEMHEKLLLGISIEDLSDAGLIKYGNYILKLFKSSKSVLRKLKPEETAELEHWAKIKAFITKQTDVVLKDLERRMYTSAEDFGEKNLLAFSELVSNLRITLYNEKLLDNDTKEEKFDDVKLIVN